MKKRFRVFFVPFVIILFAGFLQSDSDIYYKMSKSIDIFGRVYRELSLNYVDDIDPEELMLEGIKGMLGALDPYTVYIDPTMKKDIDLITTGKYGGIGATVGVRNDKVTIIDLMEGYSAQRQGIRIGDVIKSVDTTEITKENYDQLSNFLKGDPGKVVNITIERDGAKDDLIFEIVLEEIKIKNLSYYAFYPAESNNVYLKLSGFSRSAGDEILKALTELNKQKEIKSIVLDLRGNPGGLLDQAIDVSEKFVMNNQLIVSVIGRDTTKIARYFSKEEPIAGDKPLAVLIDGHSASASEIVTGAIQDHDRGIIVGGKSFGKGLVQTIVPLSYNTSLKLTTAKYYTPSGRCIQSIDYSDGSKVHSDNGKKSKKEYSTDNNRKVFASGGISPDTILSNYSGSKHVTALLARGMFFRFATHYYNQNDAIDFSKISDIDLFDEFIKYVNDEEFEYTSKPEKVMKELKKVAKEEDLGAEFENELKELCAKYERIRETRLRKYQDDIVAEIRAELMARIGGREGRVKESLKYDQQFKLAFELLNDTDKYSKLLGTEN